VLLVFVAVCVAVFFWVRSSWNKHQQQEGERAKAAAAAATCFVYWPGATTQPPLFPTEEAALLYQSATSRRDSERATSILRSAVLVVPGSRADVLERKPAMRRVRVGGDVGWVLVENCHAAPPR
jgi:hypothetical protein